ncbi:S-layer homology domain-containing protein [Petroclostridium sp. X23]|uniref:fibronectin type III domain-containing protein n=1 Tax=Petroclostridium sp. X23 TaxID=3045146 RepID=UPI0024AC8CA3|nr:S-layer homology domain-containing protein [Petroclostridium sp. X23]WHH56928.1 fibronectin type III domain-containing protein [Petroclostridium sp. X23]
MRNIKTVISLILMLLLISTAFPVLAAPVPPIPTLPYAPTDLSISFDNDKDEITLTWKDNSDNETGFEISAIESNTTSIPHALSIPAIDKDTAKYVHSYDFKPGYTYTYQIRAKGIVVDSDWSDKASIFIKFTFDIPGNSSVPAAPSDLKAVYDNDKITLTWKDNSSNETGFEISCYEVNGGGGPQYVPANTTTFVDDYNFKPGYTYVYSVRAQGSDNKYSAWSNEVSIDIPDISPTAPAVPSNLKAVYANGKISLAWKDNSSNESAFEISKSDSEGNSSIISLNSDSTTYEDNILKGGNASKGKIYKYKIRAINIWGSSAWSNESSVTVPNFIIPNPKVPDAPSDLTASYGNNKVTLKWKDNASNESKFEISINEVGAAASTVSVPSNVTTYEHLNPKNGKVYKYTVSAKNIMGSSIASNEATVTIPVEDGSSDAGTNDDDNTIFDGTQSLWAENELKQAYSYGLTYPSITNSYRKPITREEFCTIAVKLYEQLSNKTATADQKPFDDTDNPEIIKAYGLGIVKGIAPDTFSPYAYITRQEMCVMIVRTLDAAVPSHKRSINGDFPFIDRKDIADWAVDAMRYAYENGIMKGVGEGKIAPLFNTSREEGIVLIKRTYEQYRNYDNMH